MSYISLSGQRGTELTGYEQGLMVLVVYGQVLTGLLVFALGLRGLLWSSQGQVVMWVFGPVLML
jgi:hypothetical protein